MREKEKHRLTKDELILIGFSVCHTVSNLFLGTFVISFLMHNSINDLVSVSVYRLFYFFAVCVTFILATNWCKNGNKHIVFGMNIITRIILLGLIAILGPNAANWVIVLGVLYGIFDGFWNLPMYGMIIDKVRKEKMVFFIGTKTAIKNTVKILLPVILGVLIAIKSLQNVAWIIMCITIMEIFMLLRLSPPQPHKYRHANLLSFFKKMSTTSVLRKIFFAEILRGFAWVLETVVTIYIVYIFHTDMNLGIWSTVFAVCTIISSWAFGRFCSERDFKWVIKICSGILIFSAACLIIDVNKISILIYAFSYAVAIEIMNQCCGATTMNIARTKIVTNIYHTEYFVIRDIMLFIGRWIACVSMIYIGVFSMNYLLKYFIALLFLSQILACIIITNQAKYIQTKKTHAK